jgi:hypothetical protein
VIVAIFGNLEPVLGTLLGWLFGYQTDPSNATLIGMGLIVVGCIIVITTDYYNTAAKEKIDDDNESPYHSLGEGSAPTPTRKYSLH